MLVVTLSLSLASCGKKDKEKQETEPMPDSNAQESVTAQDYGEMNEDFYMEIEEVHDLDGRDGVTITGINRNTPLYLNTKVDVTTASGKRLHTWVINLETSEGERESVDVDTNCSFVLAVISPDQVAVGDVIVLKDCEDPRPVEMEEMKYPEVAHEYGEMTEDFYMEIEGTFTLSGKEWVTVTGTTKNSPVYLYTEMDVLTANGPISTRVTLIEIFRDTLEGVDTDTACSFMLEGLTKDDVTKGDVIVLRGCKDPRK